MYISSAIRPETLNTAPNEIILLILGFLDYKDVLRLALVCRRLEEFVQTSKLHRVWEVLRHTKAQCEGFELPRLDPLQCALLYYICFRKWGPNNHRTQRLSRIDVACRTAPEVFGKLLEDTFRESGDSLRTQQLLLRQGADFTQVPCGLHKLLEDTFRECGDGTPTQLLRQYGADAVVQ